MNKTAKNILALILGIIIGGFINKSLIDISDSVIAIPEGFDNTTIEGIKSSIHLLEPKHFIFPFLAHGVGTLIGALVSGLIAATHKLKFALAIGALFLTGGIMMVVMAGGPMWFIIVDLTLAYIPMAYLGFIISNRFSK